MFKGDVPLQRYTALCVVPFRSTSRLGSGPMCGLRALLSAQLCARMVVMRGWHTQAYPSLGLLPAPLTLCKCHCQCLFKSPRFGRRESAGTASAQHWQTWHGQARRQPCTSDSDSDPGP
eukprot:86396-Chlamydomonas_euryale.AAC.27